MRGTVAKRIRRDIYGDFQPRVRKYFRRSSTGHIIADNKRSEYQKAKKTYKEN